MHYTDIVTFFEDGRVLLDYGSWPSQSTAKVMSALLHLTWVRTTNTALYVNCGGGEFGMRDNKLMLEYDGYSLVPIDPPKQYVTKIDQKKLNAVAKQYKEFRTEALNWFKLVGTEHDKIGFGIGKGEAPKMLSEDPEVRHRLCTKILVHTASSRAIYGPPERNQYGYKLPKYLGVERFNTPARISACIRKLIREYHAHEVCYQEELPYGVIEKDVNAGLLA